MSVASAEKVKQAAKLLSELSAVYEQENLLVSQLEELGIKVGESTSEPTSVKPKPKPSSSPSGKRRGRPPGSKNKNSGESASPSGKRRGRPPGSKNKTSGESASAEEPVDYEIVVNSSVRGRPKSNEIRINVDGSELALPELLQNIAEQSDRPLRHQDFVHAVLESGYESESENISGVVHKALQKLVKSGIIYKDNDKSLYQAA